MADTKITALTALTAADPANDVIPIVDVSDTSMAASGTTKKISVNNILGASGTATLASATITGDLTVDTSTLKVDSTNNQVGIGTATPASYAGNKLVVYDSTNGQIAIANSTANSNLQSNGVDLYINTNVTGASSNAGSFIVRHGSGFATQLTIDSSNNVNVQNGNVVMVTSGKGIDFSATANGSGTMTSELLNDYEEGTWTGTLKGGTTDPTVPVTATGTPVVADAASGGNVGTSTIVSATYTKIGRQVSVEFYLQAIGTAGMTAGNPLTIRGFPFSAAIQAQGSFYTYRVGRNAATVSSSAFVPASDSIVQFFCFSTNSATTDTRILVSDIVSGTSELRMSVTYFV